MEFLIPILILLVMVAISPTFAGFLGVLIFYIIAISAGIESVRAGYKVFGILYFAFFIGVPILAILRVVFISIRDEVVEVTSLLISIGVIVAFVFLFVISIRCHYLQKNEVVSNLIYTAVPNMKILDENNIKWTFNCYKGGILLSKPYYT